MSTTQPLFAELIAAGERVQKTRDAWRSAGSGKHVNRMADHTQAIDAFCGVLARVQQEKAGANALTEIGAALASIGAHVRVPEVRAALGETHANELAAGAAGFRQRFPQHWPAGNAGNGGAP